MLEKKEKTKKSRNCTQRMYEKSGNDKEARRARRSQKISEQIDFLNDQLVKANRNNSPMWFAVGVVAGVFITGAAAWSLHQTASAN